MASELESLSDFSATDIVREPTDYDLWERNAIVMGRCYFHCAVYQLRDCKCKEVLSHDLRRMVAKEMGNAFEKKHRGEPEENLIPPHAVRRAERGVRIILN